MKPHCVVALLCLGAIASVACAQEIRTNCDKNIDFSHYQTYSWKKLQTNTPVWQNKIQAAVDKALAAKGWHKVNTGADVTSPPKASPKPARSMNPLTTLPPLTLIRRAWNLRGLPW